LIFISNYLFLWNRLFTKKIYFIKKILKSFQTSMMIIFQIKKKILILKIMYFEYFKNY
jgi:hypothetical protein